MKKGDIVIYNGEEFEVVGTRTVGGKRRDFLIEDDRGNRIWVDAELKRREGESTHFWR